MNSKKSIINIISSNFLNLRPYSWIDIILLGFLAKFYATKTIEFVFNDIFVVAGLVSLWFFFNLILEAKHDYEYRQKASVSSALFFLFIAFLIGFFINPISIVFIIISTILVFTYLKKKDSVFFGVMSAVVRGLIQFSYFLFAVYFVGLEINFDLLIVSLVIFVLYFCRAIIGDVRDYKHNAKSGKITIPVALGCKKSRKVVSVLLILSSAIMIMHFNSVLIALPLLLYSFVVLFYRNGFVLHQLKIVTTSFFLINLILFLTGGNLVFMNLIYLGLFLNHIFYPLLIRKSNPLFVQ